MLAFMLCLVCAMAVQGYEAETLWMQVVWLSQPIHMGARKKFIDLWFLEEPHSYSSEQP